MQRLKHLGSFSCWPSKVTPVVISLLAELLYSILKQQFAQKQGEWLEGTRQRQHFFILAWEWTSTSPAMKDTALELSLIKHLSLKSRKPIAREYRVSEKRKRDGWSFRHFLVVEYAVSVWEQKVIEVEQFHFSFSSKPMWGAFQSLVFLLCVSSSQSEGTPSCDERLICTKSSALSLSRGSASQHFISPLQHSQLRLDPIDKTEPSIYSQINYVDIDLKHTAHIDDVLLIWNCWAIDVYRFVYLRNACLFGWITNSLCFFE